MPAQVTAYRVIGLYEGNESVELIPYELGQHDEIANEKPTVGNTVNNQEINSQTLGETSIVQPHTDPTLPINNNLSDHMQNGDNEFTNKNDEFALANQDNNCLLYTSPSPRDKRQSRMPSSA